MARGPSPVAMLAATLATLRPDVPAHEHASKAERLARIGSRCKRLALESCNGIRRYDAATRETRATYTDADEARAHKARAKASKDAAAILAPYGVDPATINTFNDARGRGLSWRFPGDKPPRNSWSDDWSI